MQTERIEHRRWNVATLKIIVSSGCVLVLCLGCWLNSEDDSNGGNNSGNNKNGKVVPPKKDKVSKPEPMLKGWEQPKLAILFTGEQRGYIEPCGCSETQSGGLSRRGDLVRQLQEEKQWATVGFDLGGTLKSSGRQSELKLETIRKSLSAFGYAAMGIGPEELRLKPDYLVAVSETSADDAPAVPFVSANVTLFDDPSLGVPIRQRVVVVNGVKIGITSVLGKGYLKELFGQGNSSPDGLIRVDDPIASLKTAVESLKSEKPDLMVLLSHCPVDETETLVKQFPDFHLVLTAGGPEDGSLETKTIGNSLVLDVGHKGKYVGVVGYYPESDSKLKFERVELDKFRFKITPSVEDRMRYYQEQLKVEDLAATLRRTSHPDGYEFTGAEKCGECHKKAYQKWGSTNHGKMSFKHLITGREGYPGEAIPRIYDPECLKCHVTGWDPKQGIPYESGYVSQEKTPHLLNQQCENCHGPGSKHVELEELWKNERQKSDELIAQRKYMHKDRATAEQQICTKCHDYENSPKFKFDKYWQEVWHPWRD